VDTVLVSKILVTVLLLLMCSVNVPALLIHPVLDMLMLVQTVGLPPI